MMAIRFLAILTVIAAFALPAAASYFSVYVAMIGLVLLMAREGGRLAHHARHPAVLALALAFFAIVLATLASGPLVPINWLGPAVLVLPLLGLGFYGIARAAPRWSGGLALAGLALAGTALGLVGGVLEIVGTHVERAGLGNNPIHYSGIMVLLGFASLAGLETGARPWRYVFLAGPIMGMGGALLSGSRGPFLAGLVLALVVFPLIAVWHRRARLLRLGFGLAVLALGAVLAISPLGPRAVGGVQEVAASLAAGDLAAADEGRAHMLGGAGQAFIRSPVWGYGWSGMMTAAERFYPPDSPHKGFDHLHADIANFSVMAGSLGVLAYALLIAAPVLAARRARAARRPALLLAITTALGFFVLGLTNTLFGLLPQTVLYASLMGWLLLLGRDEGQIQSRDESTI